MDLDDTQAGASSDASDSLMMSGGEHNQPTRHHIGWNVTEEQESMHERDWRLPENERAHVVQASPPENLSAIPRSTAMSPASDPRHDITSSVSSPSSQASSTIEKLNNEQDKPPMASTSDSDSDSDSDSSDSDSSSQSSSSNSSTSSSSSSGSSSSNSSSSDDSSSSSDSDSSSSSSDSASKGSNNDAIAKHQLKSKRRMRKGPPTKGRKRCISVSPSKRAPGAAPLRRLWSWEDARREKLISEFRSRLRSRMEEAGINCDDDKDFLEDTDVAANVEAAQNTFASTEQGSELFDKLDAALRQLDNSILLKSTDDDVPMTFDHDKPKEDTPAQEASTPAADGDNNKTEKEDDTTGAGAMPVAAPTIDFNALLTFMESDTCEVEALHTYTDKWRKFRHMLMVRLCKRLDGVDSAIKEQILSVDPDSSKKRLLLAQVEHAIMTQATCVVRTVAAQTRETVESLLKTGNNRHEQMCRELWKVNPLHELGNASDDDDATKRMPELCKLPSIKDIAPDLGLDVDPEMVDLGSDTEDEATVRDPQARLTMKRDDLLKALNALQAAYESRDSGLRTLAKKAVETERAKVNAILESQRQRAEAKQHVVRKRSTTATPDDGEAAAHEQVNKALLVDHLPDLLRDMVGLAAGFSDTIRKHVSAAQTNTATGVDLNMMADLLHAGKQHARGGAPSVAHPSDPGVASMAVRRSLKNQLLAAQTRLTAQEEAKKRGFQNIVQLGVQRARTVLRAQFEQQASILSVELQKVEDELARYPTKQSSAPINAFTATKELHMSGAMAEDGAPDTSFNHSNPTDETALDASLPTQTRESTADDTVFATGDDGVGAEPAATDLKEGSSQLEEDQGSDSDTQQSSEDDDAESAIINAELGIEEDVKKDEKVEPALVRLRKAAAPDATVQRADDSASEDDDEDGSDAEDEKDDTPSPKKRSKKRAKAIVLDEEDQALLEEQKRNSKAAKTKSTANFMDIIKADAEAAKRDKQSNARGMLELEAESEDDEEGEAAGMGTFGAQTLLGRDGQLVNRLMEDLEERRAIGEGVNLQEELKHVVDELDQDELEKEGNQAALMAQMDAENDVKDVARLQKAIATGNMAALRRKGQHTTSFARDAAGLDEAEEEALLEMDEEDRLVAEEEMRAAEAEEFLSDGSEEEEQQALTNENTQAVEEELDPNFNFEEAMRARMESLRRAEKDKAAAEARMALMLEQQKQAEAQRNAIDPTVKASKIFEDDEDAAAVMGLLNRQKSLSSRIASSSDDQSRFGFENTGGDIAAPPAKRPRTLGAELSGAANNALFSSGVDVLEAEFGGGKTGQSNVGTSSFPIPRMLSRNVSSHADDSSKERTSFAGLLRTTSIQPNTSISRTVSGFGLERSHSLLGSGNSNLGFGGKFGTAGAAAGGFVAVSSTRRAGFVATEDTKSRGATVGGLNRKRLRAEESRTGHATDDTGPTSFGQLFSALGSREVKKA